MEVNILEPSIYQKYENFLEKIDYSMLYYSIKYKLFLEELLDCKSKYYIVIENDKIIAVYPTMYKNGNLGFVYNSLPFYGSNGGVLSLSQEAAKLLIEEVNKITKSSETAINMYISNPLQQEDYSQLFYYDYKDYRIGQFTLLELSSNPEVNLMKKFHPKTRNSIRKAMKSNITIEIENHNFGFIEEIHRMNMKEIGGKPKDTKFFKLIPKYFEPEKDYNIYIAKINDNPIAGLIVFYYNKIVEYYTPVIVKEYRSLQPLSLIIYQAMIDSSKKGYSLWNWGGTWKTQISLYRFKKRFGAIDKIYHYYIKVVNKNILKCKKEELIEEYPNFYTVPFNLL